MTETPDRRARWGVLDIEGTLTPTALVHTTLYDYARPRLAAWIADHRDDPVVVGAVHDAKRLGALPANAGDADVVALLHRWMAEDRKAAPLKTLQGLVWQQGYAAGELTTRLFPDVAGALRAWRRAGVDLAVFSSGSVTAQVAAFAGTDQGDLTGLFAHHFDTVTAGPKQEPESYQAIARALGAGPASILFASDVPTELDAAASAGWQTLGVARPGEPFASADFGHHPVVETLAGLTIRTEAAA